MVVRILGGVVIAALLLAVVACGVVIYLGNAAAPSGFRQSKAVATHQTKNVSKPGAGVVRAKVAEPSWEEKARAAEARYKELPGRPDPSRQYTLVEAEEALDDVRAKSRDQKALTEVVNMWYVFLGDPAFTKSAGYGEHRQKLAAMAKDSPPLATPLIAMAQSHLLEAWEERGYGPEDEVLPEVRERWRASAGEAGKLLEQAIQIGVKDGEAYVLMLEVARIEGWPFAEARQIFEQGRQVEPSNTGIYEGMAEYLLPRWHGQPGDVEKFASEVPKMLPGEDGLDAYFHIVYAVNQYDSNLLFWGDFDRKLLAQSAEVAVKRHPGARNMVPLAALCTVAAQDREAARRIRPAVNYNDAPRVWIWQSVADDFVRWCDAGEIDERRGDWIWGAPLNYPGVAFSADSKGVWCASGYGAVAATRWKLDSKTADVALSAGGSRIEKLVVDESKNWVAATIGDERQTGWMLWDTANSEAADLVVATSAACRAIAIHPKLPEVAFADGKTVRTMDVSAKAEGKPLELNETVEQIEYSADGQSLAVSGVSFSVWDARSGEKRYELPAADGPTRAEVACEKMVRFDDQGRVLAIVFGRGAHPVKRSLVRFAADGKTWETLIADLQSEWQIQPRSAVLSPDRRHLAVLSQATKAGETETILVWSIGEGTAKRLGGHEAHVGSMAFSPDGTKLASVSQVGGPLKIWELSQPDSKPRAKGK